MHHHVLGHARGQRLAALGTDEMQGEIDARRYSRTRCERAIHDEQTVIDHVRTRRECSQRAEQLMMRRALARAELSGACSQECSRADREQPVCRALSP